MLWLGVFWLRCHLPMLLILCCSFLALISVNANATSRVMIPNSRGVIPYQTPCKTCITHTHTGKTGTSKGGPPWSSSSTHTGVPVTGVTVSPCYPTSASCAASTRTSPGAPVTAVTFTPTSPPTGVPVTGVTVTPCPPTNPFCTPIVPACPAGAVCSTMTVASCPPNLVCITNIIIPTQTYPPSYTIVSTSVFTPPPITATSAPPPWTTIPFGGVTYTCRDSYCNLVTVTQNGATYTCGLVPEIPEGCITPYTAPGVTVTSVPYTPTPTIHPPASTFVPPYTVGVTSAPTNALPFTPWWYNGWTVALLLAGVLVGVAVGVAIMKFRPQQENLGEAEASTETE